MRKNTLIGILVFLLLALAPGKGLAAVPGPFALFSPANGATGLSTAPLLTWEPATNAFLYEVHFGTTNPPDPATCYIVLTGTLFSPAASNAFGQLLPGVIYYWYVDAVSSDSNRTTNIGGARSFRTFVDAPGAFSLLSPADAATGSSLATILTWEPASDAVAYQVHLGTTNPPAPANTYNLGTQTSFNPALSTFGPLLAGVT